MCVQFFLLLDAFKIIQSLRRISNQRIHLYCICSGCVMYNFGNDRTSGRGRIPESGPRDLSMKLKKLDLGFRVTIDGWLP